MRAPDLGEDEALEILRHARIEPVGTLTEASNLTLLVELHDDAGEPTGHRAVYKPVRGERPLRDFPDGTLAGREVAAYLLSAAGAFDIVPPTVLREGPLGPGSLQWWVDQEPERLADPTAGLVEVLAPEDLGEGWLPIVPAQTQDGHQVVIAHADDPRLRTMAVLDVVLNNADRKAAHLTLDPADRLRGFDHGLCLHEDDKLRTILWGWSGEALSDAELGAVDRLAGELGQGGDSGRGDPSLATRLADLLQGSEVEALAARLDALLAAGTFPSPPQERYPLPWPLW